jgi:transposase-like protein
MDAIQSIDSSSVLKPLSWGRSEIAFRLQCAEAIVSMGVTQQHCADKVGVPRTTLQNWMRNRRQLCQDAQLTATEVHFFRITPRARVPT